MRHFARLLSPSGVAALSFFLYAASALGGVHQASLWSQVTYLWDHGWTIANWHLPVTDDVSDAARADSIQHAAHRLRYFLTYPLFRIGEILGVDADAVFRTLVPFLTATSIWSAARILEVRCARSRCTAGLLCLSPIALVFLAMDGRLIFAHCGYVLLLAANIVPAQRGWIRRAILSLVALWLTAVTSGTFFSAFVTFCILTGLNARQAPDLLDRIHAVLPLLWATMIFKYDLLGSLIKNVTFFGGGLTGVVGFLSHGFGRVFLTVAEQGEFGFLALFGALIAFLGLCLVLRKTGEPALASALVAAVCMGALGTSMFTLALIPASLLVAVVVARFVAEGVARSASSIHTNRLSIKSP